MTPENKIKKQIIFNFKKYGNILEDYDGNQIDLDKFDLTTDENVDEAYDLLVENDGHHDLECEMREGEVETNIPSEYSRHFESKSVATKLSDGSWVGWTYWYGGGKHSEPGSVEWMPYAYNLTMTEEEKLVTIQTFTKVEKDEISTTEM